MATIPPAVTPSAAPTNKSVAATGASAFGAAVATIALYFLGGNTLPPEIQTAITTIITALVTGAAAYFTPPGTNEAVVVAPDGSLNMARRTP
ncbi:MAG TPA: hypothetical protein VEW04_03090 [Allosphingosinicella sp.]|nr:hypothetical protein [Allosphingosinicella sp.]